MPSKALKSPTVHDLFESPDAEGDSKGWLLCQAETLAQDAGVDLRTLLTRAVKCFLTEHLDEFIADPEAFRIPTEEEDAIVENILLSIEPGEPDMR